MGRRKKRRLRDRHSSLETAVETVDFAIESSPAVAPPSSPDEPPGERDPETFPSSETQHTSMPDVSADAVVADPVQDVQTLGELLQQAREARGLSLEAASARTRISTDMLRHLENDRFGEFAADAYVKGFLRNYGGFLGLDIGMLLRRYEAISGRLVERDPEILELETAPRRRRRKSLRRFLWPAVVVLALLALGWIFWSRGAARLGLRPQPGLEQIEAELRDGNRPLSVPGLVPDEPSILLPEPQAFPGPFAPRQSADLAKPALPASEQSPLPSSPLPQPATPTQRREPQANPAPPAPQPVEDLVPSERP